MCTLPGYLACRDALSTRPLAKVHCPYSLADAGTLEEASAWRWLRVHGAAVKRLYDLTVVDKDVERLSILQLAMPALERVRGLKLRARPGDAPATRAFLVGAARAVARCPCLRTLQLLVELAPKLGEQLPDTFGRELADACTLMNVSLRIMSRAAEARDRPAAASVSHLVTGLAGLSRLRALSLTVENACMEGAVPACMSCLAQLTTLSLSGFLGLRCAPGWAHLPALVYLGFKKCEFSVDSDAALPGMDMLVSLRSLTVDRCPSLRTWPTSLWRLGQLSSLTHGPGNLSACELARLPRGALPAAELPASALCFPAMTNLTLAGHNLLAFPRGVLGMTRLVHLDLEFCCFEHLPEGVCMLTALTGLYLGRHSATPTEVGGALDVRALGSLAGHPKLRILGFSNCSVLFCGSFQAAAAHPSLEQVEFHTSYPASGPSCRACLGFALDLLQRGRPDVLELTGSAVEGAGQQDSSRFRGALQVAGFPL